jgi:hypothetical protein
MVDRGEVSRVWFFGATNETCLFATGVDGDVRRVGEGYPVETSGSPESPLAVAAYVRDRYVLALGYRSVSARRGVEVIDPMCFRPRESREHPP